MQTGFIYLKVPIHGNDLKRKLKQVLKRKVTSVDERNRPRRLQIGVGLH